MLLPEEWPLVMMRFETGNSIATQQSSLVRAGWLRPCRMNFLKPLYCIEERFIENYRVTSFSI
jgi:hypothetical protein